jgi:hypothetical protein
MKCVTAKINADFEFNLQLLLLCKFVTVYHTAIIMTTTINTPLLVSGDHFNVHWKDASVPPMYPHHLNDLFQLAPSAHVHNDTISSLVLTTALDNCLLSSRHDNLNNSPGGDSDGSHSDEAGNVSSGQVSLFIMSFF